MLSEFCSCQVLLLEYHWARRKKREGFYLCGGVLGRVGETIHSITDTLSVPLFLPLLPLLLRRPPLLLQGGHALTQSVSLSGENNAVVCLHHVELFKLIEDLKFLCTLEVLLV